MRLVFAGTPSFAAAALDALIQSEHHVALVLTRPDAAAGRGLRMVASDVKRLAMDYGLTVSQPATLRDAEVVEHILGVGADAMVVAAYGLILPSSVIEAFPYGCINIHASLLPRWRGAAPVQRALLAGDSETGISIMRMEEGLDTGPVYLTESTPIAANETAASLHDKLAELGARTIVRALAGIASGALQPRTQSAFGATYASKITKSEAQIRWTQPAVEIERAIRAFDPFPGAFSHLDQQLVKVWAARLVKDSSAQPGKVRAVTEAGIVVACGSGALCLTELQRQGGKRLPASEFLRGFPIEAGQRFAN
ncbi:MAG: methionyl-tRNA formyltransferase [Betaproteobacteria bacterium]|jgi:methionyl-tRNA formyltransferase|nr:MAG: methionyl-tRNA formyltransferase [Betaproteobacteria bacterium]